MKSIVYSIPLASFIVTAFCQVATDLPLDELPRFVIKTTKTSENFVKIKQTGYFHGSGKINKKKKKERERERESIIHWASFVFID